MKVWWQSSTPIHRLHDYRNTLTANLNSLKRPDTEIHVSGVDDGSMDLHYNAIVAINSFAPGGVLNKVMQAEASGYDAVAIGCFLDPAMQEARELLKIPVFGLGETSMLAACMYGHKFSGVAFHSKQEMMREQLRELLDEVCPPKYAEACDNEPRPPREAYEALAKHGWFGLSLPPEFGGTGGSALDLAIMLEEIGRHFEELGMWVFRTLTYGGYAVVAHGTQEQKATLLPKILRGEISFCFGLTEPSSGSDAAALTTRASATEGGFLINGQKIFTSGMDISDYCLLVTRTTSAAKKQHGITNFLVDTKLAGIEVRKIATLGQRAIGTTEVFYSDVKVPASAVLGKVDHGWEAVDAYLWYERLCLSAARTGAASAAFEYALEYAKGRKQFGQPIGKFQAISHKLADMKVMLDISRTLVYRFAWLISEGKATREDAAVLKLYTGETYKAVSDMGLQILGGYGYCMEYPLQRFFRDSRLAVIGAGTSEIQRNIIARGLGL